MKRNSVSLLVMLILATILVLALQVLASDSAIPEPKIERHPEILDVTVKEPPFWPIASPTGSTVIMTSFDLRNIDLTDSMDLLQKAMFDTLTIWPEKLPVAFNPDAVMEWGKDPGIGLRELHELGITGKGVNVAIIDRNLYLEHPEYKDQIKMYEEINNDLEVAEWHASGVVSAMAGKTIGVAPEVNIYYISYHNATLQDDGYIIEWNTLDKAIRRIINVNKLLPEDQKIRVLSISNGWIPSDTGYQELMDTIQSATEEGIFVISGNLFETHHLLFHGMDIDLNANRNDFSSYRVLDWNDWIKKVPTADFQPYYEKYFMKNFDSNPPLLIFPCNRVTLACSFGPDSYIHYYNNGWSQVIPYIAGMYALACQVYPDITPEKFWEEALATGQKRIMVKDGNQYVGKFIDPTKLMEKLKNI